jgi:hypothetical protein
MSMTDDQADKILKELKAIKQAIWIVILVVVLYWATRQVMEVIAGPPPPPVVSIQPPR